MTQQIVVGLIVALAALYAIWRWMPARWRRAAAARLAAVKRETNSWRYVWIMAGYLFGLAYVACFITYRVALALGAG